MAESETKMRICEACGGDCSGQPRIKDAKGRYLHKTCAEKVKARAAQGVPKSRPAVAAAVAAAATRPAAMDDFLESSLKLVAQICPSCSNGMPEGTRLCVRCGYDFESGKTLKTVARVEKAPKGEKGSSGSAATGLVTPPVVSLVYGVVMIGAGFLMAERPAFLLIAIAAVIVYLVMLIVTIVVSFMEGMLRGLAVMFIPFYILYYLFALCENQWVKWLMLTSGGVWITIVYGFTIGGVVDPSIMETPE